MGTFTGWSVVVAGGIAIALNAIIHRLIKPLRDDR
jgi:hypothetical protein